MSKKLDPKIIRIGDRVRIVNPLIFIRCGYPLCKDDIRPNIIKNYGDVISELVRCVSQGEEFIIKNIENDNEPGVYEDYVALPHKEQRVNDSIVEELTFIQLASKQYGGDERSIHTRLEEKYRNKLFQVAGIKYVKTGRYVGGGCFSSYDDYDPPCLTNSRTHKVLSLKDLENPIPFFGELEIESCHVVKESKDQKDLVQDRNGDWIENPSK